MPCCDINVRLASSSSLSFSSLPGATTVVIPEETAGLLDTGLDADDLDVTQTGGGTSFTEDLLFCPSTTTTDEEVIAVTMADSLQTFELSSQEDWSSFVRRALVSTITLPEGLVTPSLCS